MDEAIQADPVEEVFDAVGPCRRGDRTRAIRQSRWRKANPFKAREVKRAWRMRHLSRERERERVYRREYRKRYSHDN